MKPLFLNDDFIVVKGNYNPDRYQYVHSLYSDFTVTGPNGAGTGPLVSDR